MYVNTVILVGRAERDAEHRNVGASGVVNIRMFTVERYTDRDGQPQTRKEYHSIVYWAKDAASIADRARAGQIVSVQGSLSTRSYEKDGQKKWVTEVKASRVSVEAAPQRAAQPTRPQSAQSVDQHEAPNEFGEYGNGPDEIPF